jgi:hypothetical protein
VSCVAAIGFGLFSGWISGNQAATSFDVIGVSNLLGAAVFGFAPSLGVVFISQIP